MERTKAEMVKLTDSQKVEVMTSNPTLDLELFNFKKSFGKNKKFLICFLKIKNFYDPCGIRTFDFLYRAASCERFQNQLGHRTDNSGNNPASLEVQFRQVSFF